MTEDEAKAKDCCGPQACGKWVGNRRLCTGSQCMGWDWLPNAKPRPEEPGAGDCMLKRKP